MTLDQRQFRNALGCFASGIVVATGTMPDGTGTGVTISAFSSLSLDPPLILFCLGRQAQCLPAFVKGRAFAINVLSDQQKDMSIHFAAKQTDKMKGVKVNAGKNGAPLLSGCLAHLECECADVVEGGDHLIVIGRVDDLSYAQGGQPLLYYRGSYGSLANGEV